MNQYCVAAGNRSNNRCGILSGKTCDGDNKACKFRMTQEELKAARNAAFDRIASLPEDEQVDIAWKYYDGAYPWRRESRSWNDDTVRFSRDSY